MSVLPQPPPAVHEGLLRRYAPMLAFAAVVALAGGVLTAVRSHATPYPTTTIGSEALPITPARALDLGRRVDFGPGCDLRTGRIRVPTVYAPPCVPPFLGSNGGATARGVTRSTIVVAVYEGAPDFLQEGILASGGTSDTEEETFKTLQDYVAYFEAHYQTYGRHVRLVKVEASGAENDDAAARADAIRVATEIKAFASIGGPTMTEAYAQELAARHVLCIECTTGTTDSAIQAEAPYVWGIQPSPEQQNILTTAFIAGQLAGLPAVYAGEGALRQRTRVFGLLAYDTPTGTFGRTRQDLVRRLAARGVKVAAVGTYTLDVSRAQELARTLITGMKEHGVTSVIFDGDPFAPIFLTKEATAQRYFPEWVVTGSVLTDTSAFARLYDQNQWRHAFGISELPGRVREVDNEAYRIHEWQFGTAPPAPSTYPLIYPGPLIFFTGVHLAGPDLRPATFRDALFSFPPSGGGPTNSLVSFGNHGLWPHPDYLGFDDAAEIWWDPAATGEDEVGRQGTGLYRYADGGRRHVSGAWPAGPARLFAAGAPAIFDPVPDRPPTYPPPSR